MSISGFSLSSLKNTLDDVRASVYPRNETERKVYEALSSLKNYGASSTQMNDIASETFDYEKYKIITSVVFANLETDGKPWKQIFKTLTLIEFLIKNGAERFIEECRDKLYKIRALQDFNFYEGTVDKGSGVREKAKQVVELLGSNEMIRTEREKARVLRNKLVGIDSRNGGGGGGFGGSGSYGGSSGNSYGGNGSDSRYDSGSGGNSYGGDSRYGDSGIGSRSGGTRYGDSGIGSNSSGGGNRYGGGAYDSNRPGRYNDEAPPADSFGGGNSNSRYSDEQPIDSEPEPVAATTRSTPRKSTTSGVTGVSSTAGKLKVNIKKVGTPATTSKAQPAAAEVDLIGGEIDLMGGGNDDPFGNSAGGSSDFDPFQTAPAAAPAASGVAAAFDPFATNSTAPLASSGFGAYPTQAAPAFDPFAAAPQPVMMSAAPTAPAFNNNSFPTAGVQPQYGGYSTAPPAAPVGMMGGMISYGQPMQQQPVPMMMGGGGVMNAQQQQYRAPQQGQQMQRKLSSQSNDADFGDFTGATSTSQGQQSKPAAAPADPWGSLVNLSKIEKNDELANKQRQEAERNSAQQYSANSFAGLDGFSKAPQNMSGARPVNSYQQSAPMGMAPTRPLMNNNPPLMNMGGGGMNPNMMGGGMGMGMPAGGMAPMNYGGAPMGFGAPVAPSGFPPMGMGGMPVAGGMGYPPAASGYPPNNAGGYGAPMGNMGYPNAGNMPPNYPRGF
jgi:epsin